MFKEHLRVIVSGIQLMRDKCGPIRTTTSHFSSDLAFTEGPPDIFMTDI